jgi:hypothetical protein
MCSSTDSTDEPMRRRRTRIKKFDAVEENPPAIGYNIHCCRNADTSSSCAQCGRRTAQFSRLNRLLAFLRGRRPHLRGTAGSRSFIRCSSWPSPSEAGLHPRPQHRVTIARVATVKRAMDLERGPLLLVGHSYGGIVITEAGERTQSERLGLRLRIRSRRRAIGPFPERVSACHAGQSGNPPEWGLPEPDHRHGKADPGIHPGPRSSRGIRHTGNRARLVYKTVVVHGRQRRSSHLSSA